MGLGTGVTLAGGRRGHHGSISILVVNKNIFAETAAKLLLYLYQEQGWGIRGDWGSFIQ